jgi:hypothetical protein
MSTGVQFPATRMRRHTSSPLISGISTSRMTTSGATSAILPSASGPSAAITTSYRSAWSTRRRESRTAGSSSTMSALTPARLYAMGLRAT